LKKEDTIAPIKDIVASSTDLPQLVNHDAQHTKESIGTTNTDESRNAKGERIFAVQYRIIKKRSDWPKIWRPKPPPDFDLNDLYVPDGPSMYGNADEKDDGEDSELDDDDDDEDDDPTELGDIIRREGSRSVLERRDPWQMTVESCVMRSNDALFISWIDVWCKHFRAHIRARNSAEAQLRDPVRRDDFRVTTSSR